MLERSHLESYICYCKYQKNLNNKTLKAYRIDLMQFFSWFFPYDACVSSTHIELYIEHLAKTYKTSTVKRKIAAIKSFYQYLIYKEYLEHSPFEKLQVHLRQERLLPRTIDNYTLSRIFSAAYSDWRESQSNNHYFVSMRDVAVLELLFATGVRVSELCSITCENLNLQNQVVLIKGKGSKERCIYISSPPVISALASYSALRTTIDSPDPYFFLNRDKHRLSEQSVRRIICRYTPTDAAHYTPHMFRHSFATYLWEQCGNIYEVKEILGHSSVKTTERYVHASFEQQKRILTTMHPRNTLKIEF